MESLLKLSCVSSMVNIKRVRTFYDMTYPFKVSSDNGLKKIDIKLQDLKTEDQADAQSRKEANCLKETSEKRRVEEKVFQGYREKQLLKERLRGDLLNIELVDQSWYWSMGRVYETLREPPPPPDLVTLCHVNLHMTQMVV